ncbi:DUF6525 family protein [Yoonia sp.]|uniref:DUF6525 family protein n=1 Tax=Yoonia sp. TaxID=2212373 RepID=UPI00358DF967
MWRDGKGELGQTLFPMTVLSQCLENGLECPHVCYIITNTLFTIRMPGMSHNCGTTTLKRKRCTNNAMHDFDRLPQDLRQWMTRATLPWRAKSVQTAYQKALRKTGCHTCAMEELDRIQASLIRKDAGKVWGAGHPAATGYALGE